MKKRKKAVRLPYLVLVPLAVDSQFAHLTAIDRSPIGYTRILCYVLEYLYPHISAIDWAISACQSCCMGVFSFYFSRSKSSFYYLYDSDATSVSSSHGA